MKKVTVGKATDNDLVIGSPYVSRYHADIIIENSRAVLYDHSTNGTWVNGQKVHNCSCPIGASDQVLLPGNITVDLTPYLPASSYDPTMVAPAGAPMPAPSPAPMPMPAPAPTPYDGLDDNNPTGFARPSVSFGAAFKSAFQNYVNFSGRARRSEFWWFQLANALFAPLLIINILWYLASFLPSLALCVRRLHDTGRSGWWLLLGFIPLVGNIILLVWYCQDSTRGANKYGPSPKYQ